MCVWGGSEVGQHPPAGPPGQQQHTEGRLALVSLVRRHLTNQAFDLSVTAETPESGSPTVQPDQLIRVQVHVPSSS